MELGDQELGEPNLLSQQLPYPVVKLLLEYLDISVLKALRLVCKASKSWIESPELLRRFPVRITGADRLDDLVHAPNPVPWNNFIFYEVNYHKCLSDEDIQPFVATYGELVRELEFNWRHDYEVHKSEQPWLNLLLHGCPHLETLRIQELNFDLLSDQLLDKWKNMRHFHVECFRGSRNGLMPFFSRLLSNCSHLETLTVPMFKDQNEPLSSIHDTDAFQHLVFTPLLDTIAQGRLRSVSVAWFDRNEQLLLRLALACLETGAVLRYASDTFLAKVPPEHLAVLDIIGDLYSVTDAIIQQQPLTNVRTMHFTHNCFRELKNCAYTMPPFPHLDTVKFHFRVWDWEAAGDMEAMELFAHRLTHGVRRPTVTTLHVAYDQNPAGAFHTVISPVDLCTSFVNLRVLHVEHWEGEDAEWLKLWPLVGCTLVELWLEHCPNLSDRGILGDDLSQPAFLQLKLLRQLKLERIVSPGRGKITELSFIHAFRHMRLRSFDFFEGTALSTYARLSAKTVKAIWDGAIGENIEHCFVQWADLMRPNEWSQGGRKLYKLRRDPRAGPTHREPSHAPKNGNACCSIA